MIHERRAGAAAWAVALALLGGCAAQPGGEPGARRAAIQESQADPDRRASVRLELATGYYTRGQFETALEEARQALAAKPDLPEAHDLLGLIYQSLGEAKLAEENFRRALQLRPGDPGTLHNYGWFLCQQQRYGEAQAQFQRAIDTPRYAGVPRSLMAQGVCLTRAGSLVEAERSLKRSYEIDPSNPVTAFNLADALYRLGEYERARFYVARVNAVPEYSNAQTLWLAARIEHKAGNARGARDFGRQLRNRFPDAPQARLFDRGRFDD